MPDLAGMSKTEQVAALRSGMRALGAQVVEIGAPARGAAQTAAAGRPSEIPLATPIAGPDREPDPALVVAAPEELAEALPGGGLPRGKATQSTQCPALIVALLSQATAAGGYAAVVGWDELSLAGVAELGGALERIAVIPKPGADPLAIVGALVEGMDLVVFRSASRLDLSVARSRPLLAKLRKGTAALVLVECSVPSPAVLLEGRVAGFRGIRPGRGRIVGFDVEVSVQAKGYGKQQVTLHIGKPPAASVALRPGCERAEPEGAAAAGEGRRQHLRAV